MDVPPPLEPGVEKRDSRLKRLRKIFKRKQKKEDKKKAKLETRKKQSYVARLVYLVSGKKHLDAVGAVNLGNPYLDVVYQPNQPPNQQPVAQNNVYQVEYLPNQQPVAQNQAQFLGHQMEYQVEYLPNQPPVAQNYVYSGEFQLECAPESSTSHNFMQPCFSGHLSEHQIECAPGSSMAQNFVQSTENSQAQFLGHQQPMTQNCVYSGEFQVECAPGSSTAHNFVQPAENLEEQSLGHQMEFLSLEELKQYYLPPVETSSDGSSSTSSESDTRSCGEPSTSGTQ